MLRMAFAPSDCAWTRVPQWAQWVVVTRWPLSDVRSKADTGPEQSKLPEGTENADTNGAPLSFWHALQWQCTDHTGGAEQV